MKVYTASGSELDANFDVHLAPGGFELVFESWGGRHGGPNPRNLDYRAALLLILERLAGASALLTEVAVASTVVQKLPPIERVARLTGYALPIRLTQQTDLVGLRTAISTGARKVGQDSELAFKGGGSSRRLALKFQVPSGYDVVSLKQRLSMG
jgi:hypothetical protein